MICQKCGDDKPLTVEYFHKKSSRGSGFITSACKECRNARVGSTSSDVDDRSPRVKCLGCGEEKPQTKEFFFKQPSCSSGFNGKCKECFRKAGLVRRDKQRRETGTIPYPESRAYRRQYQRENREAYRGSKGRSALKYRQSPHGFFRALEITTRARCSREGISCDLQNGDLLGMFNSQSGRCSITGDHMTLTVGQGRVGSNVSLDRKDPAMGYVKHNLQLTCDYANRMKQDMDMEGLFDFCIKVLAAHGRIGWADAA